MRITKHFRELDTFLPNLRQSWILLLLTAIVGMLVAGLGTLAVTFAVPSAEAWADLIIYPLVFLPATLYIIGEIKNQKQIDKIQTGDPRPSIPLNQGRFGRVGVPLSFIIILALVFSFNISTEPLYSWMGVPDFLREFYENIKANPWNSFFTIVIFAPLFEEFLCRGIILRGLLHHTSPWKAILWSSFMFAIMHLNPWQALPAFLVGILMGWVYWRTKSLWATIFIHFVNNGFSFLVTVLFPALDAEVTYASIMPERIYIIVYAFSIIFSLGAFIFLDKNYDKPVSVKV